MKHNTGISYQQNKSKETVKCELHVAPLMQASAQLHAVCCYDRYGNINGLWMVEHKNTEGILFHKGASKKLEYLILAYM